MKFRTHVEPPEPMRGLEVPPEVVAALGEGARPPVTITINGHSWQSRVAIMRGRHLLGLSNANRQAAGVEIGEEVEVELELDTQPRVVVEPPTSPAPWTTTPPPAPRTTTSPTAASASTCTPSRARSSPTPADAASRRPSPPCGARSASVISPSVRLWRSPEVRLGGPVDRWPDDGTRPACVRSSGGRLAAARGRRRSRRGRRWIGREDRCRATAPRPGDGASPRPPRARWCRPHSAGCCRVRGPMARRCATRPRSSSPSARAAIMAAWSLSCQLGADRTRRCSVRRDCASAVPGAGRARWAERRHRER